MSLTEGIKDIAGNMVASYATKSRSIESFFDTTHQILEGFPNSFLDTRQEREKINAQLRENLTKNESLRRKDFDRLMQDILSAQEDKEKQVKEGLNGYLAEQRETIRQLGDNLAKFKDALARGEAQRIKEFQALLQEILAKQDERKKEVTSQLKEFQKQQQELAKSLKELLSKGRELRIKDLKSMLGEFQARRQGQIAEQGERRRDVRDRLEELKKERLAAEKNRQDRPKKTTQARTDLRMDR
jgi:DNA repair exonuclease SbcCD ATPase subunit